MTRNRTGKIGNGYAAKVAHMNAPKLVWMAIAFSLAQRITEDDPDAAVVEVAEEWRILHANGIVPQKPRARNGNS